MYASVHKPAQPQRENSVLEKKEGEANAITEEADALTEQEERYGNMLLRSVRFIRSQNSAKRMEERGRILRNNFLSSSGEAAAFLAVWLPLHGEKIDIFEKYHENSRDTIIPKQDLDERERAFLDNFYNKQFYVTHATKNNSLNKNGDLILYSRKKLMEKEFIFPKNNSTSADIRGLSNDDYVFFALEVGGGLKKQTSRFGNIFYKLDYHHPAFEHSAMSLFDQYLMELPEPKIPGLSEGAKDTLRKRDYKRLDIVFQGRDKAIISLAHAITRAARSLPEVDRQIILDSRSDDEINRIINSIFRPEIRVPGMLAVRNEHVYAYRFGNR